MLGISDQLVVALMTKWLLLFEDPQSEAPGLGKALPRHGLANGKTVSVQEAPTRWRRIGFIIKSRWIPEG